MATMNPAASPGVPYTVPPEPSRLPALLLAVVVHAVLLGFLYVGVNWQNTEPVSVEAEVWDMRVQDAAPLPPPEPPQPAPQPEPAPPPRPEPVKEVEPAPVKPDIALERKKQKELEQKQLQEKEKEKEKREREREERLAEEKRQKEELKKKEQEKKLAEQKEKEKQLAEKKAAEKLAKAKAAEEQKRLEKLRAEQIARITGAAGSGTAAQSTAPKVDGGYRLALMNKIKNSTSYLGSTDVPGNPRAEFKVEQLPTGEIIAVRMTKSSGIAGFDDAVEKGIMKASPLPKKKDGTVERSVTIGFSMKDLD
jgi:colicin import membrane protein